ERKRHAKAESRGPAVRAGGIADSANPGAMGIEKTATMLGRAMSVIRTARAGSAIEDYCRACKADRMHTVVAADSAGQPLRVTCGFCRSEHNYRGGPRTDASGPAAS